MTVKELVAYHLQYTLEKDSTQPSLVTATQGLSASQASWRPSAERHSIWQIVRHLINFHEFVIRIFDGWTPSQVDLGEFVQRAWQDVDGDDAAWLADTGLLRKLSQGLVGCVERATDEKLASLYLGRRPFAVQLQLVAAHAMYHAGQIRYLRALQGA